MQRTMTTIEHPVENTGIQSARRQGLASPCFDLCAVGYSEDGYELNAAFGNYNKNSRYDTHSSCCKCSVGSNI
jgi:hypothetical protein